MAVIKGKVTAETVEVRFAFSGKTEKVYKHRGDTVKTGDFLASLDRRELQTVLDRELADYEKVRAEFEIFVSHNPNPSDDLAKYRKVQIQATLDASVKAVELAKFNLDEADLVSPVNGVVLDNSGLRARMNITPGSYGYKILDTDSVTIEAITDADLKPGQKVKIGGDRGGEVTGVIPDTKGNATVRIRPEKADDLKITEEVEIEF